jgi:MtrB/PioB family decaheme-associated outer membrane protein
MLKPSLRAMMVLGACLVPLAAQAADNAVDNGATSDQTPAPAVTSDNEVLLGLKWQSQDSAKFGRYNGSPDEGFFPFGSFVIRRGDAWDSGNTHYYDFTGDNLIFNTNNSKVLPNSSASFKFGQHGSWGIDVFYDNITYTQSLKFNTPYSTSGNLLLGTPGGISLAGIALTNPPNAADVAISANVSGILTQRFVGSQRNKFGVGVFGVLSDDWTISTNFVHEHKDGTKENSFIIGSGNPSLNTANNNFIYFPELIDYDTDRFSAVLAYSTPDMQAQVTYVMSSFNDNRLDMVLLDPFATNNVKSVPLSATYSTPPSSIAHQIKAQFGYNFSSSTRLNASFAYGLQLQNERFAPESTNPSVPIPPGPGTSFDGKVQTLFGTATLTSRPLTGLDLKASYTIDDRDNQSPRFTFNALRDDTNSLNAITTNAPYSFQYQKANAEAGYSVMSGTRVVAGYTYERRTRTFSAADRNSENTVYAHVNTQLLDEVFAILSFSHGDRTSSTYDGNAAWLALGDDESGQFDNHGMVHYSEAPRRHDEVRGDVSWMPRSDVSLSVSGRYYNDDYPKTLYGITKDNGLVINPDLAYQPTKNFSAHLFYTYERIYYRLDDVVNVSGSGTPATRFFWTLGTPNTVHTAGVSGDWQATDKLKLDATYVYQHGTTAFNENGFFSAVNHGTSPWNYNVISLPSNKTVLNSATLQAEYQWSQSTSIVMGYLYEQFSSADYINVQAPTSPLYANEILGADGSPDYNVSVITAAVRVKL